MGSVPTLTSVNLTRTLETTSVPSTKHASILQAATTAMPSQIRLEFVPVPTTLVLASLEPLASQMSPNVLANVTAKLGSVSLTTSVKTLMNALVRATTVNRTRHAPTFPC